MKVIIPRGELKEALSGLQRVIPSHSTLPILQCVRFETSNNTCTALATDLDQTAMYRFPGAQLHNRDGAVIIANSRLKALAKGADDDPIEIESAGDDITLTNSVGGQQVPVKLKNLDPADWPPSVQDIPVAPVDPAFLENLRKIQPFATKDSTRYILQGVFMDVSQKDHFLVATDGRRLTCLNTVSYPIPESCILPTNRFLAWNKLAGPLSIGFQKERQLFHLVAGPWDYVTKLVDGTFPNWRQVLPSEDGPRRIVFSEEDVGLLRKILPSFPGHDTANELIKFTGAPGLVTVAGRGPEDREWTTLELKTSAFTGTPGQIGVNRWYFLEALEVGFRSFSFTDERSPIQSQDGHGGRHVLMPLRLEDAKPVAQETPAEGQAPATEPPASTPATTPPAEPNPSETPRPAKTRKEKKPMPKTEKDATVLDKLIAACEGAKAKIKEANDAVTEILSAAKDVGREDKQRRTEIAQVRTGLAKLQTIKV